MSKDKVIPLSEEKFKRATGPLYETYLGYSKEEGRNAAEKFLKITQDRLRYIDQHQQRQPDHHPKPGNNL